MNEYWLTYAVTAFLENFWYLVVAMFGAVVGSFLGVVIYRLPIMELTPPELLPKGYSLSNPPSYCPHCRHKLESWENVPILGFLWLRGRCSDCKKPIPWRDFAMEILTASAWVAIFHRYNGADPISWINVILIALFASVLIAAVFIDLDHFIVPEALNRVGVIIGLARDLAVLGIAFLLMQFGSPDDWSVRWNGAKLWQETLSTYTYYGWLPRGFVGAALYAGLLWLVSFSGFVFYARAENESFFSVARRFFTYEDAPESEVIPAPNSDGDGGEAVHPTVITQNSSVVPNAMAHDGTPQPLTPPELRVGGQSAPSDESGEEYDDSPPVRLRFSPGFIVLLSAGFLAYVIGPWSILAFLLPLVAFITITRTASESAGDALRRFFRSDDLPYEYEAPTQSLAMPKPVTPRSTVEPVITGSNVGAMVWDKGVAVTDPASSTSSVDVSTLPAPETTAGAGPLSFAEAQADADQFAKEAESGAHGGMGLGDVKLAVAIGAILGPGQAVLSLIFAAFFGAVTGLILKAIHRKNTMRLAVPFVPFMAAGAFVCLLFGEQIITWYLGFYAPVSTPVTSRPDGPRLLPDGRVELPSDVRMRQPSQSQTRP